MNRFDINHFYKYGFAFIKGFQPEKAVMHQAMKKIKWVDNKYDKIAYKIPDWVDKYLTDHEYTDPYHFDIRTDTPNNQFDSILTHIIRHPYFFNLHGGRTIEVYEVDFYNGTHGLDWHFDGAKVPFDCPWFMMLYFNDDWDETHGGEVEFGEVKWDLRINPFDSEESFKYSANAPVERTKIINPTTNTSILGMNHNPRFVHSVHKSNPAHDRLSLLVVFKVT